MLDTITALRDAIAIAESIQDAVGIAETPSQPCPTHLAAPQFSLPEPITAQLTTLGLSPDLAERLSQAFLHKAEQLRTISERTIVTTCSNLVQSPRSADALSLNDLRNQVVNSYHQKYRLTICDWTSETIELARSRLASVSPPSPEPSQLRTKKSKRQFKSEYLPLFEFAFEKDRFPSREDKKHLARISGMSYRQVCVWFQNRRSRHASRAKSHHVSPPPQTFEEMKERLSASAREALSKPVTFRKASHETETPTDCSSSRSSSATPETSQAVLDPAPSPICFLGEKAASPTSTGRSASLAATDDGYESDYRDGLEDDNDMDDINLQRPPMSSPFVCEPAPVSENPLNPLKTPTANVFPAVYAPSKLTFDPFVVEHEPWLRSTRGPRTRSLVDLKPEALEDILGGLNNMDVIDVEMPDVPTNSQGTRNASTGRLERPLPRRKAATASAVMPPTPQLPIQRTFSSSSFGSSGSWSSDAPTALSRSSSFSTAPSSILSSPHFSEISLLAPSECAIEVPSDYAPSPLTESSPSTDDDDTVCETPLGKVTSAGPFDLSSKDGWEPASKSRVSAWMTDLPAQEDENPSPSKWEQLLAAASVVAP